MYPRCPGTTIEKMTPNLSIAAPGDRERFLPLLLLADESEQQVRSYIDNGDLYVYSTGVAAAAGVILAIPLDSGVVELKAVAVEPSLQGQGVGRRMLADVLARLRTRGCSRQGDTPK